MPTDGFGRWDADGPLRREERPEDTGHDRDEDGREQERQLRRRDLLIHDGDDDDRHRYAEQSGEETGQRAFRQNETTDRCVLPTERFQDGELRLALRDVLPHDLGRRQHRDEQGDTHGDVMHRPDFKGDELTDPCRIQDALKAECDEQEETEQTRR